MLISRAKLLNIFGIQMVLGLKNGKLVMLTKPLDCKCLTNACGRDF